MQQALLKLVEGTNVTLNVPYGQPGSPMGASYGASPKNDTITIDTSNILFIFMGAFTGLDEIILEKLSKIDKVCIFFCDIIAKLTFLSPRLLSRTYLVTKLVPRIPRLV